MLLLFCWAVEAQLIRDLLHFIQQLEGDVLLVCVGRRPYTTRLGLEVSLVDCHMLTLIM